MNQNLKNIYNDVLREVYPQIANDRLGVLYKVIHIILEEKVIFEQEEQIKAEFFCNLFSIKNNATFLEDKKVFEGLIMNARDQFNPKEVFKSILGINENNRFNERQSELLWIVLIACFIVGTFVCIQFIKRRKSKGRENQDRNVQYSEPIALQQPVASPPQSLLVALCLVVPAHVLNKLKEQYPIDANEIENLIDNASYFLCTKVADAELVQQRLDLTDENILTVGERREVYVRIDIRDGQEMLDKTVPYILKRNLPSHRQGVVKQLACLGDLSGLEAFNRI
ncbi:hypothetical protein HUN01_07275 [Nostoc edaphicum CCNP1411]|uniref:Uncharacterized protein n=1 Tax=Nostoc edaphicum CCNP1411 TaxID=1472755 RepID=A0A7D7LBU5_9NOSO|nr:hypothetical protein [Nostoc edaphicum]QMS87389.1 hypothetical protein HUN01_07275 [Nostoc edaphicum CCNP1411]